MTTISGSTSALSSLAALYSAESGASSSTDGGLTSAQVSNLVGIVDGGAADGSSGLDTLLGHSTTSSGDLSSIIDAIEAEKGGTSATTSGTASASTTASTATTDQQKAAAIMQSIYQTQQANLFTLLG